MTELAAQPVDRVIPDIPARRWILSLPWSLPHLPASDGALCRDALAVFNPYGKVLIDRCAQRPESEQREPDGPR